MLENLVESSLLLLAGVASVLTVLMLMAGLIWALKSSDEWINRLRIRRYAQQVETKQVEEHLNDEIVAVLAAAATTTLRSHVRVRRVRFLGAQEGDTWAVTGRLNVMASHQISKRKS